MNAPPFPLNPSIGDWWQNWVFNGARWVASPTTGQRVITRTFAASGPYMPSPGLVSLTVRCIGGGGGGGSAGPVPDVQYLLGGGGGGSGGYSEKTLPAALVRGGVLVTIGAGGTPGGFGAASGAIVNGTGGEGGVTTFGALCVANGGSGGVGNNANQLGGVSQNGYGGPGATPGTGDVAWPGTDGWNGVYMYMNPAQIGGIASAGRGGWIIAGGPNAPAGWAGQWFNGVDGPPNTGCGGSGAFISEAGGGPLEAGSGGSGLCIVTETVVGDRDQPVTEWRPPLDVNVNVRPPKPGPGWWPPGPWPPGWPPGWGPGGWPPGPPWPPGWGPGPWPRGTLPQGREFEAGVEPFGDDPPEDS